MKYDFLRDDRDRENRAHCTENARIVLFPLAITTCGSHKRARFLNNLVFLCSKNRRWGKWPLLSLQEFRYDEIRRRTCSFALLLVIIGGTMGCCRSGWHSRVILRRERPEGLSELQG